MLGNEGGKIISFSRRLQDSFVLHTASLFGAIFSLHSCLMLQSLFLSTVCYCMLCFPNLWQNRTIIVLLLRCLHLFYTASLAAAIKSAVPLTPSSLP
jgi:hypothetical protein